jgi:hypothetical protein
VRWEDLWGRMVLKGHKEFKESKACLALQVKLSLLFVTMLRDMLQVGILAEIPYKEDRLLLNFKYSLPFI